MPGSCGASTVTRVDLAALKLGKYGIHCPGVMAKFHSQGKSGQFVQQGGQVLAVGAVWRRNWGGSWISMAASWRPWARGAMPSRELVGLFWPETGVDFMGQRAGEFYSKRES